MSTTATHIALRLEQGARRQGQAKGAVYVRKGCRKRLDNAPMAR